MRWLVVSPYLPHPAIGHGGGTAVRQLCEALARVHEVTLLCFQREDEHGLQLHLEGHGVRVLTIPFASDHARGLDRVGLALDRLRAWWRARRAGRPLMVEKYDRPELTTVLESTILEWHPDVVQVEYGFMAPAARFAREAARRSKNRPAVFLNTHEAVVLPRRRKLDDARHGVARSRARAELALWQRHESGFSDAADVLLCVTDQDREILGDLNPTARLETVPLGADVSSLKPAPTSMYPPPRLLFVGSFRHPPNVDGALCLCQEILPRVWKTRPDVVVDIIGVDPPDSLRRAAADPSGRVHLRGFVENLDEHFEASWIFVAPLMTGGGIKIKILEAMARGSAIVTTPIGVEGIDDAGEATAVETDAEGLAQRILHVIANPAERLELAFRARQRAEREFDWKAIVARLGTIAEHVRGGRE